jgi:hypothetical protein
MNFTDAQRIVRMLTDRHAKQWQREAGRPEIDAPHIPVGWLPMIATPALHEAIDAGLVKLVDLPRRVDPSRVATFIVAVTS